MSVSTTGRAAWCACYVRALVLNAELRASFGMVAMTLVKRPMVYS